VEEFRIEFSKRLCGFYIKTTIILLSVLNFKRIEIGIYEKSDYILYGIKGIFVYIVSWSKIYLDVPDGSFEDIDYLGLFGKEIIVIYGEFSFDLNLLILEG
jgi:hypothetical protein